MLSRLFLSCALPALASFSLRAQCTPITGTGCVGQGAPVCGTPPQIGTNFVTRCAPTCFGTGITQYVIVGIPLGTPTPINPPIVCTTSACGLGCQPLFIVTAPGYTIAIPNNTALIGAMICMQCICYNASVPCITLTQANKVTVI